MLFFLDVLPALRPLLFELPLVGALGVSLLFGLALGLLKLLDHAVSSRVASSAPTRVEGAEPFEK